MGVFDKIKNALFEVEYVEVDDVPKIEKKKKNKEKNKDVNKPIAKKIVLPGKREQKVEELKEEELKTDNFEVRPLEEEIKETKKEEFKFMDDNDFKVDEEIIDEPKILQVVDSSYDENNYDDNYVGEHSDSNVEDIQSSYYTKQRESRPYGMDDSYSVQVHEYGTYDKKEDKTHFRPSPIISPIYGILDKNYKKEDVVSKRDVHLSSEYRSGRVSVDDVRNKAYGSKDVEQVKDKEEIESKFEIEEEEENKVVDLNDRDKPEVKEVTMGDALEYFQDLGLEYNVDYVDISKDKSNKQKISETNIISPEEVRKVVDDKKEDKVNDTTISDDDNLFDLIDSMYQEKE